MIKKEMKIIRIIDRYQVVVNAGAKDSIRINDSLEIYSPGISISDPDTGELLGNLDYVKAHIRVKEIFPKMCVCINDETESISFLSSLQSLNSEKMKTLNIDSKDIAGGYENIDKKIKVGDLVRESL